MSTRAWDRFVRHGGRVDEAARLFGRADSDWLDLSTGINPVAWSPGEPVGVDVASLPPPSALARLEEVAASCFGVDRSRVAAVPGSEIALRLLRAIGLPAPITATSPCYATHAAMADRLVDDGPGMIGGAGTLLIANPNNPDGRVIGPAVLHRLAAAQARAGGWLVVDEAFADAMPGDGVLPGLDPVAPVVVLRSFGKFFGLAGLRLGFVVAPPALLGRLRILLGDWPVGAHAIAWGTRAYADEPWIARTRSLLAETAAQLDAVLARHGLVGTGACPLFRLVTHPGARGIFDRLAQAGILTRPFAERPDWLRFGLPPDAKGLDRLDRAFAIG